MIELRSKCCGERVAYFYPLFRYYVPVVEIRLKGHDKKGWMRFDFICPRCYEPCKTEEKIMEVRYGLTRKESLPR